MTSAMGPITYGKDFNFFTKISVSSGDFSYDADTIIKFPADHISFYNEGAGVVEVSFNGSTVHCELNPNTGTSNITIRKEGISKIWLRLKSGGTSDVRIQSNCSVDNYITPSAYGGTPIQVNSKSASADAFGRLRVSNPYTIFESKQLIDDRSITWSTKLISGGTSTFNSSRASSLLAVTSTTGSSAIRQTKQRINYQPGKSLLIEETFVMGETPPGITKEIGFFDGYNGCFLRNDGYNVQFVIRSSVTGTPIDNAINQSDWNLDKLDGYGASGLTLDITKAQILLIDIQWLGTGRVRFGFNINGATYYAHEETHANLITSVYMSTSNLPLKISITNDGYAGTSSFEQICTSALSEGGFDNEGYDFSADRGVTPLASVDNVALYPLISIRLDNTKPSVMVELEGINMLCTSSNANFRWVILLNPTIGGTDAASWQNITYSGVQYDVSRTLTNVLTGGTILKSGYATENSGQLSIELDSLLRLGIDLDNNSDEIVIGVQKIAAGTDSFIGSISWKEFV